MTKRMLIDATHPEETRVVVVSGTRLEDFDVEVASRKQIKGNIYLAKVTRVEPSLQAAFVDYGGNRHGFLAFNEIHPDYYQIPVEDREALLAEYAADNRAAAERAARAEEAELAGEPMPADQASREDAREDQHEDRHEDVHEDRHEGEPEDNNGFQPDNGFGPNEAPDEAARDAAGEAHAGAGEHEGESAPTNDAMPGSETAGESTGEASADESQGPQPENGEREQRKPASVEVLGGDSDDDIETRRPVRGRRHYKIQEVIKRRQIMLVQVVKEERGSKGAALTTYLSLAGRYCVLMPNTARGGGISRKIAGGADRKRLKSVVGDLEIPDGMAVIVRTAGAERTKTEIKRDFEYLMRAWTDVRKRTLESIAPALVYEEGSIVKRAIRDLYANDVDDVVVAGEEGYRAAKDLMRHLVPSHAKKVQLYRDPAVSLFRRYQVEDQLALIHNPRVQLRSGGYIVINPTEALVSIDVNSGRATRERHIEETAFRTNTEAADEIARQLRLRDLAGLIVIDFIDMESSRNQMQVERRLKEAMRHDRARIQIGRISHFGLLEMSRQRLRPSLAETSSVPCPHCDGTGLRRSTDSSALVILRAIEEEGARQKADEIVVHMAAPVALYILNQKRAALTEIEQRFAFHVILADDDSLIPPVHRIERTKARTGPPIVIAPPEPLPPEPEDEFIETAEEDIETAEVRRADSAAPEGETAEGARDGREAARDAGEIRPGEGGGRRRRRRRGRGGRGAEDTQPGHPRRADHDSHVRARDDHEQGFPAPAAQPIPGEGGPVGESGEHPEEAILESGDRQPREGQPVSGEAGSEGGRRRRRRGRRGGRNRRRPGEQGEQGARPQGEHPHGEHPRTERPQSAPDTIRTAAQPPADEPRHREFRVTTPAEAGIAFLDGPRFGAYDDHGDDEHETPPSAPVAEARPEPQPESRPKPRPEPTAAERPARAEPPVETRVVETRVVETPPPPVEPRAETPEERERRLRASKTEIIEVSKTDGAPSKRGWWRRGG